MMLRQGIRLSVLSTIFALLALPAVFAQTTQESVALQRGYRTGYSDGYMAGYRDTIDSKTKSYVSHGEYIKADRAYNNDYGTITEYKDGYQQGFEVGYDTGFGRRSFDQNLPTDLKTRGTIATGDTSQVAVQTIASDTQTSNTTTTPDGTAAITTASYPQYNGATVIIPRDTELIFVLKDEPTTEKSRTGDKFTAKVVSPSEIAGATVEGRVQKITAPGRIRRRSELALTFDRILLTDNRWSNFNGMLIEVMPVKGDNVKRVDNEGMAIGQSSYKNDAIKVGGATGVGLVTGAVIAGPVGAGVGAAMGAAFGVGAVVIERGKHIRLGQNQQLRIKTAYETQIR